MSESREIPVAEFRAMEERGELARGPIGDGRDGKGRSFAIYRYTSKLTGKRYDLVHTAGEAEPRCIEYPKYVAPVSTEAPDPVQSRPVSGGRADLLGFVSRLFTGKGHR